MLWGKPQGLLRRPHIRAKGAEVLLQVQAKGLSIPTEMQSPRQ